MLCAYVKAYDEEHASTPRQRNPLHRAALGRCFRLRIRNPQLPLTIAQRNSAGYNSPILANISNVVSTQQIADEIDDMLVHENMTVGALKHDVSTD